MRGGRVEKSNSGFDWLRKLALYFAIGCCIGINSELVQKLPNVFSVKDPEMVSRRRAFVIPSVVLDFHTSRATFNRMSEVLSWLNCSYVRDGLVIPRIILGRDSVERVDTSIFKVVRVPCTDERNGVNGHTCRVQKAYEAFLRDYPNGLWYFRAMDDTWLDMDNFMNWMNITNYKYNPLEDLVVLGHANHEHMTRYFLHGGVGWLMSRAMLQYQINNDISLTRLFPYSKYQQDDTSESIITRALYERAGYWDEMLLSGFECETCKTEAYKKREWDKLPLCQPGIIGARVRDIIGQHTFGNRDTMLDFGHTIRTTPENILFYRVPMEQKIYLCREIPNQRMWGEGMRRRVHIRAEDVKEPLINWKTLTPDPQ